MGSFTYLFVWKEETQEEVLSATVLLLQFLSETGLDWAKNHDAENPLGSLTWVAGG